MAQERALENADMDSLTSLHDDDDNYTIAEPDRVSSVLMMSACLITFS